MAQRCHSAPPFTPTAVNKFQLPGAISVSSGKWLIRLADSFWLHGANSRGISAPSMANKLTRSLPLGIGKEEESKYAPIVTNSVPKLLAHESLDFKLRPFASNKMSEEPSQCI
jgi:hypothetical protein